ncbi:glycosyltransferase family 2 protein [Tepidibacter mesophilus]|uniref:glycosyltransferase family 2 protein n=1 Tax=Tepidibacter mesophilus TaxID=655607 RepID=UPI001FA90844|nr:glycosyltransferase family 2 protein [Tepidibacter mesophilus]
MKNIDVSIIIVNFKTYELTKQTVNSILSKNHYINYEIILVDNNSSDESIEKLEVDFKQQIENRLIKTIKNDSNLGFSKANNIGIRKSEGEYVLILNSDTVVVEDCLDRCIEYIKKDSNIGALGSKVVLPDGNLDKPCKRGFPTPKASLCYMLKLDKLYPNKKSFGEYNLTYLSEDDINEVDSLVGAFMIIPRRVIDEVGMLDEDFFMYGEDIDWCYRIKKAGYKIIYYPKSQIIHYKGSSAKKKRFKTIYEFHRAMYLFYNKHYKSKYSILTTLLVYSGISFRLILTLLINLFKK